MSEERHDTIIYEYPGMDSYLEITRSVDGGYQIAERMSDGSGDYFSVILEEKEALRLKTWLQKIGSNS